MINKIEEELDNLKQKYTDLVYLKSDFGQYYVEFTINLPDGWSSSSVKVAFYIPHGYPFACPCDFYADCSLNLSHGGTAKAVIPNELTSLVTGNKMNLYLNRIIDGKWNPNLCSLKSYIAVIKNRFNDIS